MSARVLAISLDAADADLVMRWADEGRLPHLRRLMESGATARLRSIARDFPDAVFATVNTGCYPGTHGHYNWRCVVPGTTSMVITPLRTRRLPFWEVMRRETGCRLLLVDVQQAPPLRSEGVTQIIGYGQRAARLHESWPPELYGDVVARYGRIPRWIDDDVVRRSIGAERRYLRAVHRAGRARAQLLRELLQRRDWDFAFASFHEAHNAGHVLYRYLEPGTWAYDERRAARFRTALLGVYRMVDDALGRVLEVVPEGTDVLVFACHGFRLNTNGLQLLPRILTELGYQVPAARQAPLPRLLNVAATRVPWSVRRHVNARLSPEAGRRALERMWSEAVDWRRTRAVAETAFGLGWVRINLRGREPHGIVEPGREYDELCHEIAGELRRLTIPGADVPAVEDVWRVDAAVEGPNVSDLPDLQIRWSGRELVRAVHHPRAGTVHESMADLTTAEHGDKAFVIAAGPRIRPGVGGAGRIVDLAPTLLHLMGARIPQDMEGAVLDDILQPAARDGASRAPLPWSDDPWEVARSAAD